MGGIGYTWVIDKGLGLNGKSKAGTRLMAVEAAVKDR